MTVTANTEAETRSGALRLRTRAVGSTHSIVLAGELDLANVDAFQALLEEAKGAGASAIVLDLEALEFIDSSGIAVLIQAHRALNEHGDGTCCLRVIPSPALGVKRVLEATGLDSKLSFLADGAHSA